MLFSGPQRFFYLSILLSYIQFLIKFPLANFINEPVENADSKVCAYHGLRYLSLWCILIYQMYNSSI